MIRFLFALQLLLLTFIAAPHAFAQNHGDGDYPGYVPTENDEQLDPKWQKTVVLYRTTEAPGTIIVNTKERFLYVVQGGGRALRYGIGVGRDGFQWQGLLKISNKKEWPDWTPPPEMIQRQPYLPRFMAGGPGNPLGARAQQGFGARPRRFDRVRAEPDDNRAQSRRLFQGQQHEI